MTLLQLGDLERKILIWVSISCGVLAVLGLLIMDQGTPYIMGLIFGAAIGYLNFLLLGSTLKRAVMLPPAKAQSYTTSRYFIRYVITGSVIYVSIVSPKVHVLGAIIGLLLIKFVVIATNLFNDKRYFKNIFKRKEEE